ncbi:MAG: amidase [Silicimonas sp.]|nr:amidase [Silicimonas sp.]
MDKHAVAPPIAATALDLRDRLASGALSVADLADAVIARIEARDPEIHAFTWFDPDFVRKQAAGLDAHRISGRPLGALHGLPVALKDVIDTAGIPTENGCPLDKGRIPQHDAVIVERLRAAGALIVGKTVTAELAFMFAGATRNPHNPDHTPGGSSSGSAAAVADGMVPLAVGTQTGGSVIRPAAFCGITGFKPTFGLIPRTGVLSQSPSLDTVGVFAADPTGAALLADVLAGHDRGDAPSLNVPAPRLLETAMDAPPLKPVFAFIRMPGWDKASPETHAAFEELTEALGEDVFAFDLPAPFDRAADLRACINFAEMAHHYRRYNPGQLGPQTREALETGRSTSAADYLEARDWQHRFTAALGEVFERCDAILCPAAPGPAPEGLEWTGDSIFNGLWTMVGTPAITLPLLTSESGLPMGVQLVGPRHADGRLLRTARWLYDWADNTGDTA